MSFQKLKAPRFGVLMAPVPRDGAAALGTHTDRVTPALCEPQAAIPSPNLERDRGRSHWEFLFPQHL